MTLPDTPTVAHKRRPAIVRFFHFLWQLTYGVLRDFIWTDLREGMLRLDGLSPVLRGIVLAGFGLLLAMVVILLQAPWWRGQFTLTSLLINVPGRGSLMPVVLVPLTLFYLSLAWSFALAGSLHSPWALRLGVLFLFALTSVSWIGIDISLVSKVPTFLAWGILIFLFFFCLLRGWAQPRPELEFTVILIGVMVFFALVQNQGIEQDRMTGFPLGFASVNNNVMVFSTLILPLLMALGTDIADFTRQLATWGADGVQFRLPAWAAGGVLLFLLVWRAWDVGAELLEQIAQQGAGILLGYVGGLGACLSAWMAWQVWKRVCRKKKAENPNWNADDLVQQAGRVSLPLSVLNQVFLMLGVVVLSIGEALTFFVLNLTSPNSPFSKTMVNFAFGVKAGLDWFNAGWPLLFDLGCLLWGIRQMRKGKEALGLFLTMVGIHGFWLELTARGKLLSVLYWESGALVDFWLVAGVWLAALIWTLRRRWSVQRAARLVLLLLLAALLRQTNFIENPFSPIFVFSSVALVAFALIWDAITSGSWANEGSKSLPRSSRILLYIGYVLLTVTVVNWAYTTHDLWELEVLTGNTARAGLALFGKPLLYLFFPLLLSQRDNAP